MADTSYESAKALDDAYVMHTYGRLPVEFVSGSGADARRFHRQDLH